MSLLDSKTIVVIGGWGCPTDWVSPLVSEFETQSVANVITVSLPGYDAETCELKGNGSATYDELLKHWLVETSQKLASERELVIVGWSYGGMLALLLADYLNKACSALVDVPVVTLGSRPCFVDDEYTVFEKDTAHGFLQRVVASGAKGLNYFISLTAGKQKRDVIRLLKSEVTRKPVANKVLVQSLEHLFSLDVSGSWESLNCRGLLFPVYFEQDTLINVPVGSFESQVIPNGHLAPLIAPAPIVEAVCSWLNSVISNKQDKAVTIE